MRRIIKHSKPITNIWQACQWIKDIHKANILYHFDDNAEDIINDKGEPLFTKKESKIMNKRTNELFHSSYNWEKVGATDPYDFALQIMEKGEK